MGYRSAWASISRWWRRLSAHVHDPYRDPTGGSPGNASGAQSNGGNPDPTGSNASGSSAAQPAIADNSPHDPRTVRTWHKGLWKDRVELDGLTMLADKRSVLSHNRTQQQATVSAIANYGKNGVATPAASTPARTGEDESIINRSPKTTNNNYPVRSDAPWVALIALLVMAGLVLGGMWMASQPKAATHTTPPPAGKVNSDYIEFYKP